MPRPLLDGVNLTTEVVYKRGQDYRFVCYDRGQACQSYRVAFPVESLVSSPLLGTLCLRGSFLQLAAMHCEFGWRGQPPPGIQ